MPRYLIGIDLGTTNSALASVDLHHPLKAGRPDIRPLQIPQLVAPGEIGFRPLLPSFLYLPGEHDLPAGAASLPWAAGRDFLVGEFARNHGSRIPGRLVNSAKSWLSNTSVDRSAALLPWSAPPDVPRISPVEASSRYLRHLVEAWNWAVAKDRTDERLEQQAVVLTVPASFDDVARNLTVDAAHKAGLENVVLLEEPQAAFYCWLATHPPAEAARLKPGALCLVIDVGGGTSDFSLIQAVETRGELGFVRQAVGDHLLLGGDNMDLALAKFVETRMPGAGRLDAAQYGTLTQSCRQAKETLLGPAPPADYPVTVVARGKQVIGGTLHARLSPDDVRRVVFDGFFPAVAAGDAPQRGARAGLHEMGLPYVNDPAITRHLAAFLAHQSSGGEPPAAVLFNGGVFQPASLRSRLIEVLHGWYDRPDRPWKPLVLTNPSLDLAVAWGAASFAWLRHTGGRRIGGGIARSYYVGVEGAGGSDVPTTGPNVPSTVSPAYGSGLTVLCVVPQHLEEGQEVDLARPELELALGQPVTFPLFSSTVRAADKAGDVLRVVPEQLLQLPPLHTVLRGGKRSGTRRVPVTLAARSTAIGTLELFCVARDGQNRWRLEFNVRDLIREPNLGREEKEDDATAGGVTDVWPEAQVQEAARLVRRVYGDGTTDEGNLSPQELTKALESALDSPRDRWPTGLCRRLCDFLAEAADGRRKSPAHLGRWYNLVGYCLRPGFGDPLDRFRVDQLWKMLATASRTEGTIRSSSPRGTEGGADYWIMWRRVAGGLHTPLQKSLHDRLRPALLPGKSGPRPGTNELAEMWRAAASLERLEAKQKEALGNALLKPLRRSPVPTHGFWSLTRLGARSLIYGPLNAVVHPQVASAWLEAVLPFEPGNQSERMAWAFCLSQLARRTGQRALDVDEPLRGRVLAALRRQEVPAHWAGLVAEVTEMEREEQGQMLGDTLPIGLRLLRPGY